MEAARPAAAPRRAAARVGGVRRGHRGDHHGSPPRSSGSPSRRSPRRRRPPTPPGRTCGATAAPDGGTDAMPDLTYRQAVSAALAQEMARDERVVLLGEDIASGGVFKTTLGLRDRFGPARVRNTPISETAIAGAAMGAAMAGLRPVAEIMFSDFYGVCWDQVAVEMAKARYMTGGQFGLPLVVRGPTAVASASAPSTARPWRTGRSASPASRSSPRRHRPTWSACSPRPSATTTRCWCSSTRPSTGRRACSRRRARAAARLGRRPAGGRRRHAGRPLADRRPVPGRGRPAGCRRRLGRGDRPPLPGAAGRCQRCSRPSAGPGTP